MRMLKTAADENVILACIEALGNMEEERSVAMLINLYNANELFIPSIIEALGKIGSEAAIEFITSAYSTDDDLIKYSIIECLGNVGSAKSFYFLLSELNKLDGPQAWAAVEAIYKLSQKYSLEVPFEENFKNIVLNTLYEADAEFQKAALFLVISYDDPEIFQAYLSVLGSDYEINEIVKDKLFNNINSTLQGVKKRLQAKADNIPALLALLEEMSDMHGIVFADELSRLEIEQFVDALAETLEFPHEEARKSAMNLMFKIDADSAMLFLDKMLEDDNLWNKLALLDILEEIELNAETLKILSEYVETADEMMKERINYLIESNNKQLSE
jgi:HEAT repeat protein